MADRTKERAVAVFKDQFDAAAKDAIRKSPVACSAHVRLALARVGKALRLYSKSTYEQDIHFGWVKPDGSGNG